MSGGLAPAQIIIVEPWQIVMDQRIGVNHLDGTGKRQQKTLHSTKQFARGKHQNRTNAFATRKNSVTHRAKYRLRRSGILAKVAFESPIHDSGLSFEIFVQVEFTLRYRCHRDRHWQLKLIQTLI